MKSAVCVYVYDGFTCVFFTSTLLSFFLAYSLFQVCRILSIYVQPLRVRAEMGPSLSLDDVSWRRAIYICVYVYVC